MILLGVECLWNFPRYCQILLHWRCNHFVFQPTMYKIILLYFTPAWPTHYVFKVLIFIDMIGERCYLSVNLIGISLMISEDEGTGFWKRKKRQEDPSDDKDFEHAPTYFLPLVKKYPHTKLGTQFPLLPVKILSSPVIIPRKFNSTWP